MWKQGSHREAASSFAVATQLEPNSVNAQFLLGASLAQVGDPDAAVAPLQKCVELDPNHLDGHNTLGMVLGRLGRHTEGEVHLAKAAFLGHPQSPQTLRALNMSYCRRCGGPVGRVNPNGADVNFYSPSVGMECRTCPTVLCAGCVLGDFESAISPPCPDCGSTLIGLRKDSEL
ncbi:hypothetical protein [Nonomuraea sp. NPDC049504]|uniref:hypothetical protein n=1 Tax=Nonomuraea sp. NPDC049504 TaxID=3154729 RepID=UPI003443D500